MKSRNRWIVAILILTVLLLSACQRGEKTHQFEHPSVVEEIEGSDLRSVTITEKASERIGLQTAQVTEVMMSSSKSAMRMVIPYSAIIYDFQGQTWVYISPSPLTFVRHKVDVDYIEGDIAVLNDGPPVGTVVAAVGVAELYGTEFEIGH